MKTSFGHNLNITLPYGLNASSFKLVNTPNGYLFLALVFPFKLHKSEVMVCPMLGGPFQKGLPISTSFVPSSSCSFVHLP